MVRKRLRFDIRVNVQRVRCDTASFREEFAKAVRRASAKALVNVRVETSEARRLNRRASPATYHRATSAGALYQPLHFRVSRSAKPSFPSPLGRG